MTSDSTYRDVRLRDGRALAYGEHGSPSGLPIIHCHGVPSSRVEGNLILNGTRLAALGLRVIVPDRPGIGASTFQSGRRIVDWPNDVIELADALRLDTFAVLGSSGGAPCALACDPRWFHGLFRRGLAGRVHGAPSRTWA